MKRRGDRLGSMIGATPAAAEEGSGFFSQETADLVARRRALLYVPPPAVAAPYLSLLEAEGFDVLLAEAPETAETLLRTASPELIVAITPTLGIELERAWARLAPDAEIRWTESFSALLRERIVPPGELFELLLRSLTTAAGALAVAHAAPRERAARTLALVETAAASLELNQKETAAARLAAVLRQLAVLTADDGSFEDGGTTPFSDERLPESELAAQYADLVGCPLPLRMADRPAGSDAMPDRPGAQEIVEAAVALLRLQEQGDANPATSLRRLAVAGDEEQEQLHAAAVEAVLAASVRARDESKPEILLVDPDRAARSMLALRLGNEGYTVRVTGNGRNALEEIRRRAPGLVLAETVLPGLDGYGLLDAVRAGGTGLPFIFFSSRADSASVNKGLLLGASDFLDKSTSPEVLLTKIERALGQAVAAGELSARISLADISHSTPGEFAHVSYDELKPDVLIRGRFRIESDLGEGGMGKVFRARDERLEEIVVIKVMKTSLAEDPRTLDRFKREIRLARKITHSAVVRIFDFFEAGPLKFVTMEYLEGADLRKVLTERGPFPLPVVMRVGLELFEALVAAHEVGVIHRDIKPHNILMMPNGKIKVLDFGIAQGLDYKDPANVTVSGTGSVVGTPEYMSPEQLIGERVDQRTDLYSAGLVLYEMLTGQLPFTGDTRMNIAMKRIHADPERPSTVLDALPAEVDELLLRLLQREREQRYATAREVTVDLASLRRARTQE